jgi:Glycosyl hydrolase 2 galactose-binding domain-like/Glycosyl hydrolases family 2
VDCIVKKTLNGIWQCELPGGERFSMEIPNCWEKYTERKDIGKTVVLSRYFDIDPLAGQLYYLCFNAVSYHCKVFLNGNELGTHEGMWDKFTIPVQGALVSGSNLLRIEIEKPGYYDDDPYPLRQILSGFIPDTLCTYGGIWGDVWIENGSLGVLDYHYAMGKGDGRFSIHWGLVSTQDDHEITCQWEVFDPSGRKVQSSSGNTVLCEECADADTNGEFAVSVSDRIENPKCWSPNERHLYTYSVELNYGGDKISFSGSFGFRTILSQGTELLLNDEPVYLRGILHWGYYDRDFIPVPPIEEIDSEIAGIQSFGFNAIKHCLYVPSEAYLTRADEEGLLQWVELPLWLPENNEHLSERVKREFPRILRKIAGHPSIILTSLGCELDTTVESSVLKEMYHLVKDSTDTLVRDNSGSGECYGGLQEDFADFWDYHFYGDLQNMENLMEVFTSGWRTYRPWMFGEFCDSDTLRNMPAIRAAQGKERIMWESGDPEKNPVSLLKPDFFLDQFDGKMEKSGIAADFQKLYKLSIDHSMVHRKTTLEMTRAFPEICGYNITTLRDVPICSNGLFDDLGEAKFDAAEFRRFNSEVMLLPAWELTRIWEHGDIVANRERYNFFGGSAYRLQILISNYFHTDFKPEKMLMQITDSAGKLIIKEAVKLDKDIFIKGSVSKAGTAAYQLPRLETPEDYLLTLELHAADQVFSNQWPIFTYPGQKDNLQTVGLHDSMHIFRSLDELYSVKPIGDMIPGKEILITSTISPEVLEFTKKGGGVFFVQRGTGFLPVKEVSFWREGMVVRQPHALWHNVKRTSYMDDLRMFSLSTDTAFLSEQFQDLGFENVTSVLRRYDCREWYASDYIVEMTYGRGRIIAASLRFEGGMGKQPRTLVNNPFGRWILQQSITYLLQFGEKD